jgi:hypothetical protein
VAAKNGGLLRNTAIHFNAAPTGANWFVVGSGTVWESVGTLPAPPAGAGHVTNSPGFVSLAGPDLRLQTNSPLVDASTSAGAPARDLGGVPRPLDGDGVPPAKPDIGARELASPHADTDGDGLNDDAEIPAGTGLLNPDSDGDAMRDGDEARAGTDPLDPASYLGLAGMTPDGVDGIVLRWSSASGRVYRLEHAPEPPGAYAALATNLPAFVPVNSYTTQPPYARRFYRVALDP